MKRNILFAIAALLFAFTVSCIPPAPNANDIWIFIASLTLFIGIYIALPELSQKKVLAIFGVATFVIYLIPMLWFFHLFMKEGFWYPPQPQIIQLFTSVDGEAAYDASVSNIFLVLWAPLFVWLGVKLIKRRDI